MKTSEMVSPAGVTTCPWNAIAHRCRRRRPPVAVVPTQASSNALLISSDPGRGSSVVRVTRTVNAVAVVVPRVRARHADRSAEDADADVPLVALADRAVARTWSS